MVNRRGNLKLFGVLVERKTNILALTAFIISITTLTLQLKDYILGANLYAAPPNFVSVYKDTCDRSASTILAATLPIINRGKKGYSSVVTRLFAIVSMGDAEQYIFEASATPIESENKLSKKNLPDCHEYDENVISITPGRTLKSSEIFKPILIDGGGASGGRYLFFGTILECQKNKKCVNMKSIMPFSVFLQKNTSKRKYEIEFVFIDLNKDKVKARCTGVLDKEELQAMISIGRVDLNCDGMVSP